MSGNPRVVCIVNQTFGSQVSVLIILNTSEIPATLRERFALGKSRNSDSKCFVLRSVLLHLSISLLIYYWFIYQFIDMFVYLFIHLADARFVKMSLTVFVVNKNNMFSVCIGSRGGEGKGG